ncbi:M28 family peptidase [Telluria aromaticivorans]|uniref:M20/M25/M40 family metallo-hydrolase n=1 Tax=Telluria aromaticivorans TaxID=2725995 RepID=A0A7Y2NY97_9BURK|nr:M28 family peptidase [Telluria aromaticivorans]NNG22572.1 M20/M25/M40 family metallo-hydrolase [Telluria aromaticivorans]
MRKFARSHWKIVIAILLAVALATLTLETDSAPPVPDLSARLLSHVQAIAAEEHNTAHPRQLEQAARHIETTLQGYGYHPRRQVYAAGGRKVRNIEVSVSNTAPGARPERIFIVGAHYDSARGAPGANDNGSGTAAVLELARLLKAMQPSRGTEVKFVFFVNEEPRWFMGEEMGSMQHARELKLAGQKVEGALILETIGWYSEAENSQGLQPGLEKHYPSTGNFIAFVGTLESSALVRQALAAFKAQSDFPAEGLAAPAHVMGVTLSDHASYNGQGYPALMITDTAFLRYPYYHTAQDTPDKLDYASMARVVKGLARTIESLAGAKSI